MRLELRKLSECGIKITINGGKGVWLYNQHGFNAFLGIPSVNIKVEYKRKEQDEAEKKGGRPSIPEDLKEEIRKRGKQGKSCRTIAQELRVSKTTVEKYLKG